MITARWNGEVIAEAERTVVIEGNHYFPIETVREGVLMTSPSHSLCFWKGRPATTTSPRATRSTPTRPGTIRDPHPSRGGSRTMSPFGRG